MKDTTTTIDEILGQLLGRASVEFMSHPDGKRIVMPAKELYNFQQEAKQAILQWHKDKARSYVPEKVDPKDIWKKELGQPVSDAILQADAYNEAIDQTLKAIDSKPYIGIDFAIGGQE